MLKWDEVRRLIVRHVAPAVRPFGFSPPGRTMRRVRDHFVDVIDFRCGKYGERALVAFGCGLRPFIKGNPKPWECTFELQHFTAWPDESLAFKGSVEEQVASLQIFAPLFVAEVDRWFGLLRDLRFARLAADQNDPTGPSAVAMFRVPSPAYEEAVQQLQAIMDEE